MFASFGQPQGRGIVRQFLRSLARGCVSAERGNRSRVSVRGSVRGFQQANRGNVRGFQAGGSVRGFRSTAWWRGVAVTVRGNVREFGEADASRDLPE